MNKQERHRVMQGMNCCGWDAWRS